VTGYHDTSRYRGPGVAIGRSGASIGVATFVADDYWPLNTCLFVRDFKGNEPRWVYYLLKYIDFSGFNSGSAQPSLNRNYLAGIPVHVPPVHEQRAIAEVLGALDDRIESNRRRAATAESLLDVLASACGDLPSVPLAELVEVDRISCTPSSYGDTLVDHFSLPAFDAERLPDRTPGATIKSNKLLVTTESVLVSRLNPSTNRTWLAVPDGGTVGAASTEFMVMRPCSRVGIGALWLAVRDEFFRSELARRATGTSGSHQRVRPDDALSIEVPDVRTLSTDSAAEAGGLLRLVHHSRVETRTLAELREALLPELLSGRLPVAEELIEAAT